jgi:hypothetical protein
MSKRRISLQDRRKLRRLKNRLRKKTFDLNVRIHKRIEELRADQALVDKIDGEIRLYGFDNFQKIAGELSRKEVLELKIQNLKGNAS